MPLVYDGSVTFAAAIPTLATASATLTASLTPISADLTARAAGLATLTVAPPVLVADLIIQLTAQIASLSAMIGAGIVILPPAVSGSLIALAEIGVAIAGLDAGLSLAANLNASLAVGGVHAYQYTGRADDIGPAVTSALSGGVPAGGGAGEDIQAIVYVANTTAAKTAMSALFG